MLFLADISNIRSFPFAEHLVDLNKTIHAPCFVQNQPKMALTALSQNKLNCEDGFGTVASLSPLAKVDILGKWPTIEGSSLDNSQMAAVSRILGKKLAIIQGPPGTGLFPLRSDSLPSHSSLEMPYILGISA